MTKLYDDYCSKEITDLLLEKGFSDPTKVYYVDKTSYIVITHQLAMRWLREVHNIHIAVDRGIEHYFAVLTKLKPYQDLTMKNDVFDTYEEAVEAALKYSLENLI